MAVRLHSSSGGQQHRREIYPVRFNCTISRFAKHHSGNLVAVSRSGELTVIDEGRERERYKVPYGAEIRVTDGESVEGDKWSQAGIHTPIQLLRKRLER